MKNLLRAFSYFRPDAPRLVLVFLIMLASISLNVLKPWPLALIVDSVLGAKPFPAVLENFAIAGKTALLAILSGTIFALHFAQGGFSAIQNFLSIKIGLRGLTRVRNEVFARLQRLSLRFHQGANSGDLIYRASWDTYAFQTLFQQGMITFVTAFLSLLLMVFVMAKLNGRLTLAAVALVPLLFVVIKLFGARMSRRATAAQQADSKVTSLVQQSIASMQLIQSYTREDLEKTRFNEKVFAAEEGRISQHGFELLYWFSLAILFGLGATTITWLGTKEVLAGHLTVGELLIFIAYLAQLYEPLNQLSHVGATVSGAGAGTRRVFEILDTPEEVREKENRSPTQHRVMQGNIEFKNVSFGYDPSREILHQISFAVRAGERIAIVGPSGAGKTTVINLLPRFFDPVSGSIEIDGVDLREFALKELRSQIGLVLQQPIILPTTIAENISYGKPGATLSEIQTAARMANANAFIQLMPRKYETIIGEGAARLSIGEQQRINLARAFLKDAPILLLDEPTSALDAESESLVLSGLERLTQGRTTLIVAHRLSMVLHADRILVLDGGKIVEFGTHEQLMQGSGYYSRFLQELHSAPPARHE
ncbi:MAG: ABC transporter ATP-binding protein [Verrucomicrobiota bacterium]